MLFNTKYIITGIGILLFLLVVVFSTLTISYHSNNNKSNIPIDLLDNRTNTGLQKGINNDNYSMNSKTNLNIIRNDVGKYNPDAPKMGLYGLPEKDMYMSSSLKEQIDNLANKYYYDNCRFKVA